MAEKVQIKHRDGKIGWVNPPRFRDGQFVKTTKKHYSQKTFAHVSDPVWNDKRGWIYVENFISRDGQKGGHCYRNDEDFFEEIQDPRDILIAEKLYRIMEMEKLQRRLKVITTELSRIEFSLSLVQITPAKEE